MNQANGWVTRQLPADLAVALQKTGSGDERQRCDDLVRKIIETESITLLSNRGDPATFTETSLLKLATQSQNLGVDGTRTATEWRPSHTQQLLTAPHHPWRHQQSAQQGEFTRAEFNGLLTQGDLPQQQMHFQRPHSHTLLETTATTFEQCAATCCQLLETKRFAQDVICAIVKESNDGLGPAPCRQHNHGTTQLLTQPES